jgi:hypothetical protein
MHNAGRALAFVHSGVLGGQPPSRTPGWTIAILVIVCVLSSLWGTAVAVIDLRNVRRRYQGDDENTGRGGGGPGRPGPENPRPRGGDPAWWPDFEKKFEAYVNAAQIGGNDTSRHHRVPSRAGTSAIHREPYASGYALPTL